MTIENKKLIQILFLLICAGVISGCATDGRNEVQLLSPPAEIAPLTMGACPEHNIPGHYGPWWQNGGGWRPTHCVVPLVPGSA